jgi:hypothetical protein
LSRIWQARRYPSLPMRIGLGQLCGLQMSGSARAPSATGRAYKSLARSGCTSFAKPKQAMDLRAMRLRRTGKLPWTTLRVAYRAYLRPQAPQPPITRQKGQLQNPTSRYKGGLWPWTYRQYPCGKVAR